MRIFKNEKTAKAAMKKMGIDGMKHSFKRHDSRLGLGVEIVVEVDNPEDFAEIQRRGLRAEYARSSCDYDSDYDRPMKL